LPGLVSPIEDIVTVTMTVTVRVPATVTPAVGQCLDQTPRFFQVLAVALERLLLFHIPIPHPIPIRVFVVGRVVVQRVWPLVLVDWRERNVIHIDQPVTQGPGWRRMFGRRITWTSLSAEDSCFPGSH
jgi:hypothetical protein